MSGSVYKEYKILLLLSGRTESLKWSDPIPWLRSEIPDSDGELHTRSRHKNVW